MIVFCLFAFENGLLIQKTIQHTYNYLQHPFFSGVGCGVTMGVVETVGGGACVLGKCRAIVSKTKSMFSLVFAYTQYQFTDLRTLP